MTGQKNNILKEKLVSDKTKTTYNGNIGHNILKKEFLGFNKNPKCDFSIEYNKQLLQKQLKEIFSENITTRINNYRQDFSVLDSIRIKVE